MQSSKDRKETRVWVSVVSLSQKTSSYNFLKYLFNPVKFIHSFEKAMSKYMKLLYFLVGGKVRITFLHSIFHRRKTPPDIAIVQIW